MRRFLPPLALLAVIAVSALPAAGQSPPPAPAPAETPAAAPPPQPFVVYLTEEQDEAEAVAPIETRRVGDPSPATLALLAALFLAGAYLWLRLRPPACPRCATPVSRLTRSEEDASLLAAGGRQVSGSAPGALACLACGEVVRPRFLSFMTADQHCPQCGKPTKKVKLEQLERSGYLTWGVVQIDEDCLSCGFRRSEVYPSPPLEAPAVKKGLSRV